MNLFSELNSYEFSDDDVKSNIKDWSNADFFIGLRVLKKYEYAIATVDISNYNDQNSIFNRVNENYPLGAAEKALILYLIGDREWENIHTDNKEDIFDYFNAKYGTEDLGAILEILGYRVTYNSDGTLTAYW